MIDCVRVSLCRWRLDMGIGGSLFRSGGYRSWFSRRRIAFEKVDTQRRRRRRGQWWRGRRTSSKVVNCVGCFFIHDSSQIRLHLFSIGMFGIDPSNSFLAAPMIVVVVPLKPLLFFQHSVDRCDPTGPHFGAILAGSDSLHGIVRVIVVIILIQ